MLHGRILQDREAHRHADAVVGTEGGPVGRDPLAVHIGGDRVFQEIVGGIGGLLRDHVHVALQDHATAILIARRSGFAENHVAGLVLDDIHAVFLSPVQEIFDDFPFMLGGTGNLGQSIEVAPNYLGLQIFDSAHDMY